MEEIIAQKRDPKRKSAFLKAQLTSDGLTQDVCVRDISVNGALLDITVPLRVFEIVTLVCGDTRVRGIVAWCDHGRLGMEFAELLTGETLVSALEYRITVSAPKKHHPNSVGERTL